MRWPRWIADRLPSRKMDSLELFREIYGARASWSGRVVSTSQALHIATVLCCMRVIAEGVAMLPFKVLRQRGRTTDVASDHPLSRLLAYRPNPVQSPYEFVETLVMHLVLCGNAFVWVPRVGIARAADQLWILDPGWVTVRYEFGAEPTYELRIPGRAPVTLTAADIWHVRGPSWSTYVGLDPVAMAREALGLSMAIEEGQAKLAGSGMRAPGYVAVDGSLTAAQHEQLTAFIAKASGAANADKPLILDRAAKWISTALSNVDAQTLEQRRFQIEEICRYMRVMPLMVGHTTAGTSTYGTVEQLFIAHAVHTLGPWLRRIEMSADAVLLTEADFSAGLYTKFNEKALQRMTAIDQMNFLRAGSEVGILVRNEAREKLDLNPIDGLDVPLTPTTARVGADPEATGDGNA